MNVLIAEDDKTTRIRLKSYLEKMGHGVVAAQDGKEAWEIFQTGDFSLVVTDWVMPEMDGPELVHRIRSSDHNGYVYIIILTATRSEKADVVEGMEAGADDFLTKPFDKNELRARIGAGERIINLEKDLDKRNAEIAAANEQLIEINRQVEEANARMKGDLMAAANVQQTFLPTEPPEYEGISFAWKFEPCDELAGDMLNVIPFDENHVGLYLLDVSGHGVRAALLAVTVSRMLSLDSESIIREPLDDDSGFRIVSPAEVGARLNRHLSDMQRTEQFFTIVYGILDTRTNEFRFICGGHPAPIHLSRTAQPRVLDANGYPIRLLETKLEEFSVMLKSGDRLYLYSDGVTETGAGRIEVYGKQRLLDVLSENHSQPLTGSLTALSEQLEQYRGNAPTTDDVSILGLEVI